MTTNKTNTPASTETYSAAYARLSAIAERLKNNTAATTVDSLVEDVRAAREAYALCRARLDAVRREIDVEIAAAEATDR
jgi:exonuclease VII small subunit